MQHSGDGRIPRSGEIFVEVDGEKLFWGCIQEYYQRASVVIFVILFDTLRT